jgi:hypothetical protein
LAQARLVEEDINRLIAQSKPLVRRLHVQEVLKAYSWTIDEIKPALAHGRGAADRELAANTVQACLCRATTAVCATRC